MLSDEDGLYFLTARGKAFYDRLMKHGFVALTGLKGEDTMSSVSVNLRGKVRNIGTERLLEIFEKNPYMAQIYPTEASRTALEVFHIYEASGEIFDLPQVPCESDLVKIFDHQIRHLINRKVIVRVDPSLHQAEQAVCPEVVMIIFFPVCLLIYVFKCKACGIKYTMFAAVFYQKTVRFPNGIDEFKESL